MTEFYGIAAVLVIASIAFVVWPLWRAGRATAGKRRAANITIYHQRYGEIEREVAAGRVSRREAEQEKDALGARLLEDIDETPPVTPATRVATRPWIATLVVVALMIGGAAGVYRWLGNPDAIRNAGMPDIGTMIAKLKDRVNTHPDDLQARAMLARAEQATGDYAGAANSYRALNAAMDTPRPGLIAAEAETTLQATDDLQGRARRLYDQLLDLDPSSAEALWYLGLAAAERDNDQQALDYWNRLLDQDLPDDFRDTVRNRRAELTGKKPALKGS